MEVDGSATTSETQVANNIHPDTNITQLVKYTASVVFQDAQKFDITNIYPGVCGALAFDNEAHTASADDLSYALEPCKIISLPTTLEAGGGAQEVSMDLEAWSDDGTSHPLAIT